MLFGDPTLSKWGWGGVEGGRKVEGAGTEALGARGLWQPGVRCSARRRRQLPRPRAEAPQVREALGSFLRPTPPLSANPSSTSQGQQPPSRAPVLEKSRLLFRCQSSRTQPRGCWATRGHLPSSLQVAIHGRPAGQKGSLAQVGRVADSLSS